MIMRYTSSLCLAAALAAAPTAAQTPIRSGYALRGITVPQKPTPSPGVDCDFSGEPVDGSGRMTGASVQAGADKTIKQLAAHLPKRFNAYCQVEVRRLGGARLITAAMRDNPEHSDLSAMTPKDARQRFGGAVWRP